MRVAFAILFWSGALFAEDVPFSLEWDAVAESRGYVVQLRKDGAAATDIRVSENRLKTSLPEGMYEARVAGLNKFGKPGEFSDWVRLRLERRKEVSLNLSKPAQRPDLSAPEKPDSDTIGAGSLWPAFVPGMRQIQRNQKRGYFIAGSLLFLGAHAYHQKILGDQLADSPWNNPVFLAPVMWNLNGPSATSLVLRREEEKRRYQKHQSNQRWLLGGMALIYGLQTADAILWKNDSAALRAGQGVIALEVRFP